MVCRMAGAEHGLVRWLCLGLASEHSAALHHAEMARAPVGGAKHCLAGDGPVGECRRFWFNKNYFPSIPPILCAILAWLLELPNDLRTDGHEQKALIFVAGLFGIILLFSIVFIALSTHHSHILRKIVRERSRVCIMAFMEIPYGILRLRLNHRQAALLPNKGQMRAKAGMPWNFGIGDKTFEYF